MQVKSAEAIVDEARRRAGVDTFHSESFREGLDIMVGEINRQDRFTPAGVRYFEDRTAGMLANRLKIDAYIAANPNVLATPITAPVIVLGLPRTGSSLLNNLLAVDPRRRSLLTWEFEDPIPPATHGELIDGARAGGAGGGGGGAPRQSAGAALPPGLGGLPGGVRLYPGAGFQVALLGGACADAGLCRLDPRLRHDSAYDHHRRSLQVMQHKAPGVWNLKMPSHALHIRWLLEAYPDAKLIWTHRDPFSATASLFSLIASTHRRTIGEPDRAFIADRYPLQLAEHVNRMMVARGSMAEGQLFDHHYADIVRDPLGAVRKIYAWLGEDLTSETEQRMREWLDANPQGKWVTHAYKLDEFGTTVDALRPYFADYLAEYRIEMESRD